METNKKQIEFEKVENVILENSFGIIQKENGVTLTYTIGINSDSYGWFELYDNETEGNKYYAEGGLWFKDKELIDYDGVFSLPKTICEKLRELGYDSSYAE